MDRETVLETIQRMLSLANSPNEAEAKAAMAHAADWMARHNITLSEVEAVDETEGWTTRDTADKRRLDPEAMPISLILQEFFFVRLTRCRTPLLKRERLQIFGSPENVEVAAYVLTYLTRTFRRLYKQRRGELGGRRQSYYLGLRDGLCEVIQEQRSRLAATDTTALVRLDGALVRAYTDYCRAENVGPSKAKTISVDGRAKEIGRADGRQIKINPALRDKTAGQKQLANR